MLRVFGGALSLNRFRVVFTKFLESIHAPGRWGASPPQELPMQPIAIATSTGTAVARELPQKRQAWAQSPIPLRLMRRLNLRLWLGW